MNRRYDICLCVFVTVCLLCENGCVCVFTKYPSACSLFFVCPPRGSVQLAGELIQCYYKNSDTSIASRINMASQQEVLYASRWCCCDLMMELSRNCSEWWSSWWIQAVRVFEDVSSSHNITSIWPQCGFLHLKHIQTNNGIKQHMVFLVYCRIPNFISMTWIHDMSLI